jgi:hypothetical protein
MFTASFFGHVVDVGNRVFFITDVIRVDANHAQGSSVRATCSGRAASDDPFVAAVLAPQAVFVCIQW